MTTSEKPANEPAVQNFAIPQEGKLDPILGRIDLIAALTTILGTLLLGVVTAVFAVIELARLILTVWADSLGRWLLIALVLAIVWVVARGKRLCIF
jgi:hypothetical protein